MCKQDRFFSGLFWGIKITLRQVTMGRRWWYLWWYKQTGIKKCRIPRHTSKRTISLLVALIPAHGALVGWKHDVKYWDCRCIQLDSQNPNKKESTKWIKFQYTFKIFKLFYNLLYILLVSWVCKQEGIWMKLAGHETFLGIGCFMCPEVVQQWQHLQAGPPSSWEEQCAVTGGWTSPRFLLRLGTLCQSSKELGTN